MERTRPRSRELTKTEILSMKHVSEEGYSAYATLQVAITLVSGDLERLIDNVRELVGEVDFRYAVILVLHLVGADLV
jgi:hypothetical protein